MKHGVLTKLLAVLLATCMVLSLFPLAVFADAGETGQPEMHTEAESASETEPDLPPEELAPAEQEPTEPETDAAPEQEPTEAEEPTAQLDETQTPAPEAEDQAQPTESSLEEVSAEPVEQTAPTQEPEEDQEPEPPVFEPVTSYDAFLAALTTLETYAQAYAREHAGEDPVALVINYIRCGVEKYTSSSWTAFCGEEKTAFTNYVAEQDAVSGTAAGSLRDLHAFFLPNGDEVEFAHMFGCLDMAYHTGNQNTADLGSWAGDICDLVQLTHNAGVTGTVEEMAEEIRTNNDKYFLYDDPTAHSFGRLDLYADLDAFYILRKVGSSGSIGAVMRSYYTQSLTDSLRAAFFIENRLGGASTKSEIRSAVYSIYTANEGIRTLEGTYLPNGVNPDLRTACCYAFADYLYETARGKIENPYYTVFSTERSNLAPGITQESKLAITQDDKQIAYYLAYADIARDDVSVYANYNDNDGSHWQMARVTDQMKAAEQKHTNPDDPAHYIPNYSATVGVNADFYNMSNGAPSGPLVMEGVTYNGMGKNNFFGILKDGTPIIGGNAEWEANKANMQEAVGASIWLVRNGQIAVTSTTNYYNDRASRTAVGITYDGRVVVMALDGRQEPFSCGGSAIEIAQIMLDAGCVTAVNLDGGGSTTFAAKPEGSEEITIVNRPSDGYERSVSSSLLIVSTAKPSNVFDHAVVASDYDYLTVGTQLELHASGVTATGGAIALPEGAQMRLSDETIGTLSEQGVFTAAAVGDVQVQLVSAEGEILGTKTLHVVVPTDLKFTKKTINAVLGQPTNLPMEASYNGNVVKINPNDVQFGFLKISLQAIGNVEGGTVNTTKTELVFEYPEAGIITDFDFTAAPDSTIRTLTVGAVLKSKLGEFQALISQEFTKAYQEAKAKGLSDEEAALVAQAAAISKALETAAKTTVYLYSADEATFDFNDATGGDGLLSWRREVSNANYKEEEQTYYVRDAEQPMETAYTFAVDMSKVPIPEKLTGLLYMLPGGDQEGRTAWDFMLQLAERISPLTTVTVTVKIPEGFRADVENLRLANEYLSLTSKEIMGDTLVVKCNFVAQSEPINPATANPLCVLSGFKLTPTADAPWSEEQTLDVTLTGELDYDIYAHFHILKSLAEQTEYQEKYGLYPYDNSQNIPGDYGAHFANHVLSFDDAYRLDNASQNGWKLEENGWRYYENGTALTGIRELPSFVDGEEGTFWYDLGQEGYCHSKLTGIFFRGGEGYYARMGTLVSGWQSILAEDGESYFYFFDRTDYTMYTGVRDVDNLTYTFADDGKLVRGAFRTNAQGTKYFWAGESWFRRFVTLEEGTYWLDVNGYVAYGNAFTVTTNVKDITWYHFDEQTGLLTGLCNGFIDYRGELYWCDENGKVFYGAIGVEDGIIFTATRGKVYVNMGCYVDATTSCRNCSLEPGKYWCGADGYLLKDGFAQIDGGTYYFTDYHHAKGFTKIGEDYYLFNAGSGKMYQDATMWVGANDYGVEPGMHYFAADGKMFVPDLENGQKQIVEENGKLYFTIDGVKMTNGLNELDGEYYYAQSNGELVRDKTIWVSQKNGLIPEKGDWHYFGADGKLLQTGFVQGGDGYTYYYTENVLALGFTKIGEDYYFFNAGSGKMQTDKTLWVGANPYGIEPGMHYFGPDGKLFIPDLVNGERAIVEENGKLYFTIDGVKMTNGLNELDGEYYYAQSNGVLVTDRVIWVSQKNGLIPGKGDWHYFGADGKLLQTGFVQGGDGYTYYYATNVLALGFTKIGEDYYLFNAGSGKMYQDATMWVGANDYGVEPGMHYFAADGKMFVPDLENGQKQIVEENGKLYFTIDGVKMTNGLNELDGEYYYAQSNGVLVTDKTIWVSQKNGLIPEKGVWHYFGADGKLLQTGFVQGGDGYTYYYSENVLALGFTKIGDDYYLFNAGSGKMYQDATMWVGDNAYGIVGGMYYFGSDGKMTVT